MKILSHRGYWKEASEKNTPAAFRRSFDLDFGTETDVRDLDGRLVISHDMPRSGLPTLDAFFEMASGHDFPLAINIKADGLAKLVYESAVRHDIKDYFVFDMAVPDMRAHLEAGNPVFTRTSEVERQPAFLERAVGVWLDAFENEWYERSDIETLLDSGKRVCVVSSELHGRPHQNLWDLLYPLNHHAKLMLCTDLPEQAQTYFFGGGHD